MNSSIEADTCLRRLMDGWHDVPVLLCDPVMNVRAANDLGAALLGGLRYNDNLFRLVFLDPEAGYFFTEWTHIAAAATDLLHSIVAQGDHPGLDALLRELSERSEDFRRIWAGHDMSSDARRVKRLRHHLVGELTLFCDVLDVVRLPGHHVLAFQAEPDSPSEQALHLLGTLAARTGGRP
ncbi:MmyB family transcriptional regulator [Herbidospora sp. RD11066]